MAKRTADPNIDERLEKKAKKLIRVWTDGCFDMMHFGHSNALRQAKSLGDWLVVGVHSDEEIRKNKGPPVMTEAERYKAVRACKWVDEVVENAPYTTQLETLEKYNCDFCVHGDDIVVAADGHDTYHLVKKAGKFRFGQARALLSNQFSTVPRTAGVSTTELVGRMLLLTKNHHNAYGDDQSAVAGRASGDVVNMSAGQTPSSPYTGVRQFMPSSRKIVQFSEGKEPKETDKIVYINGTFDLFHTGHIEILKAAKALGDFLIVGVLPDNVVNAQKGGGWPVMNLYERVLSVLANKYVDEVIIGAPWVITEEFIKEQNIHCVVIGTITDPSYTHNDDDGLEAPRRLGILSRLNSVETTTTSDIVDRIIANRESFLERNKKKEARELEQIASTK